MASSKVEPGEGHVPCGLDLHSISLTKGSSPLNLLHNTNNVIIDYIVDHVSVPAGLG